MLHIVTGFILLILGIWSIAANWFAFIDLMRSVALTALVVFGLLAIMSGLKRLSERQ